MGYRGLHSAFPSATLRSNMPKNLTVNALEHYRAKKGLTHRQMAKLLGVSRQMVGFLLSGERRITPERANEWEQTLGIPRERLCPEIFKRATSNSERAA